MLTNEIVLAAVKNDGNALRHVPIDMMTKEIVLAAVKNYALVYDRTPKGE
jgi:hypothetical protein